MSGKRNRFLLVCVEHLTGWHVIALTVRATAEVIKEFMETMIIPLSKAPGVVISDNTAFFTGRILQDFVKDNGKKWRIVLA